MKTFIHNSEVLYISIEELGFSSRTYNCLKRAGFNSLEDLSQASLDDYMKVRNLGRKSLNEVEVKLSEYGIVLFPNEEQSKKTFPVEDKLYKYFLSFAYTNLDGHIHFGNTEVSHFQKINCLQDIDELSKTIAENQNMRSITILNYTQFI